MRSNANVDHTHGIDLRAAGWLLALRIRAWLSPRWRGSRARPWFPGYGNGVSIDLPSLAVSPSLPTSSGEFSNGRLLVTYAEGGDHVEPESRFGRA